MPFSSIGKFLPKLAKPKLGGQVAAALALEAGAKFLADFPPLAARVRLVSVRRGVVHALALSAPAREELLNLKERLFLAMKSASGSPITDLRVELRGTLAEDPGF